MARKTSFFEIYTSQSHLKWIIAIVSVLISVATIWYTNILVNQLKQREKRQIELFANSLEYTINEESGRNIYFITDNILIENRSIPTILTDPDGHVLEYRNIEIDSSRLNTEEIQSELQSVLVDMKEAYEPIPVTLKDRNEGTEIIFSYVYYNDSFLLVQLTYYPYIQLSIIAILFFIAYLAFNYSKVAEQNRVWVGLAKETAHQLGTPISSLMAWMEFLKEIPEVQEKNIINELNKDIERLQLITARFSSIGSVPVLHQKELNQIVHGAISYLRPRLSNKVDIEIKSLSQRLYADINAPLFEWVLENICKNAVDAMEGVGKIKIQLLSASDQRIFIDISDTGKGIPKSKIKQIFSPGYTTKKRGWGLGLALARRIIENFHTGKIFVKESIENKGTTFRIVLQASAHKMIDVE